MTLRLARIPPEEAFAWIDGATGPLEPESLPLIESAGRVPATDLYASCDVPHKPCAGADGYALRASDVQGAGGYNPLVLRLAEPGSGPLPPGWARPVALGETLPDGADAVLPLDGGEVRDGWLETTRDLAAGEQVAPAGDQGHAGDLLCPAGRRLRPRDLALLGLFGIQTLSAVGRPRVRILPLDPPTPEANGPMLAALVRRDGGLPDPVGVRGPEGFAAELRRPGADLILGVGRSGPGPDDWAAATLARVGELVAWGLALHPGETAALGRSAGVPTVLLPGPPLACLCAYEMLGGRAVRRLAGLAADWPQGRIVTRLARKIASTLGRLELCRVRLSPDPADPLAPPLATPIAVADGRRLASAVGADGLVPVPPRSEGYPAGALVQVLLYGDHP